MSSTEIAVRPDAPVAEAQQDHPGENLLAVIARAVADPRLDVEKMERLLAMHRTIVTEQRQTAFMAAMARLTPRLPEIQKRGTSHQGKYARLVDIDRAIRPLIAEEGFSLSFDSQPMEGKVRVICKLSHGEGHFETKQIDLPLDNSGSKNGAQMVLSTVAYGRRALTKMFFNLIEAGEDTDGNDPTTITKDQANKLVSLINEARADKARFLKFMGVERIEAILHRDLPKAHNALDTMRRERQ